MQTIDSTSPPDAREQTYTLLAAASPRRVVIDTDLSPGTWFVVRAPRADEVELLAKMAGKDAQRRNDETAAALEKAVR